MFWLSGFFCEQSIVTSLLKFCMISFFVVLVICSFWSWCLTIIEIWICCFSCPVDKGFGGPLTCLKNKILKECREFHAWKTDMLTARNGKKLLGGNKVDEQGTDKPYLLSRYWAGAICYGRVHARRAMACTGVEMSSKHCHILEKYLKIEKSDLSPQVLEYLTPEDKIAILT